MARRSRLDFRFSGIRIDPASPVPKHRQVYHALREAVLEGRLRADDTLPSTRQLALELGVARNTVMTAYELLLAEGYLAGRGGAGTFVARNAVRPEAPAQAERIEPRALSSAADILRVLRLPALSPIAEPFRPSSPAFDAFPFALWTQIHGRILRDKGATWTSEADPLGYLPLRKAIAQHLLAVRSFTCHPDQIIIVTGAQLGIFMCSMLLMEPNDPVWIEDPGYPHARLAFHTRTNRVIPVPVDDAGIDIEAGKALSSHPRVIYVTPTHQWPLGSTMPIQRRLALIEFAVQRGAWIVEDDYDGDLQYDRRTYAALSGLDESGHVIHVGTFTKTMHPGLRIGYVVLPSDLVDSFAAARQVLVRYPSAVTQATLAAFFEAGAYARHIYEMQSLYLERHQLLRERMSKQLAGFLQAQVARTGTFTLAYTAAGIDDIALADALRAQGFDSCPLSAIYAGSGGRRGLLLGHAVANPEEIRKGVDALERIASKWASFRRK